MKNKIFLINLILCFCFISSAHAGFFNDTDWVEKSYRDGEPDYADGDLEDKLGDSGYYYDLFPEERDEEDDDSSNYSYTPRQNSKNFELTDDFIRNMKDIDTRTYRFEFPDGTTGHGTRSEYERIMREKYTYGAMKIGDNYYYKNFDGTFKTGWHEENGKWYYFDPASSALVKNQLIEYNGKVYYMQDNYVMATNQTIQLGDKTIRIDENGVCQIVNGEKETEEPKKSNVIYSYINIEY